jgi:polar amino acid transport system substrate-binding protein
MSVPFAESRACFYTRKESNWTYKGIPSLNNQVVSVIDDYGYDNGAFDVYVADAKTIRSPKIVFRFGENAGETNIKMLIEKRFSILIEHEAVMAYLLKLQGATVQPSVREAGCLQTGLPLVIGFGRLNPESPVLVKVIKDGVAKLIANGRLAVLKKKYGI